ncbi:hypothetical protein ACQ4PT_030729 [Festuca glaucescens]
MDTPRLQLRARGAPLAGPARMATGPFPITMEGETVHFRCRCQKYCAGVAKVDRGDGEDGSSSTVLLQLPCRKLKVGLIGFGALGMRLAEALVDSEFIDLVAIIIDCPISDMQRDWKKSAISLRIEDDRTIAFKKQNKGADEEVLVRVVRDRVSWDEVSIDYVVDSLHIVTHNKHVIHSMAYEGEDKAKAYSLVHDDEGTCSQIPKVTAAMELKFKYVKIVVTTAGTIEALKSNLAEWDHEGSSARICFLAHNNPTERICDPFTDKSDNK